MAKKKTTKGKDQTSADLSANDTLKAKLRHKFYLLRDEPLNYDDRDQLLDAVCTILGMNRPNLDVILIDL